MEKEKPIIVNNFVDNFDIKYIGTNIDFNNISGNENIENIELVFSFSNYRGHYTLTVQPRPFPESFLHQ